MPLGDSYLAIAIGTRPEAIKLAPVIKEFQRRKVPIKVIFTQQHPDLVPPIFRLFDIVPDTQFFLDVPRNLNQQHTALMQAFERYFSKEKPSTLIVQGDTASAMAGALAAFHMQIPIAHVEAGLRTYDMASPYPEEANRVIIDHLSEWLFAPTKLAASNLRREQIPQRKIYVSGNTIVDAFHMIPHNASELRFLNRYHGRNIIAITLHRRENADKVFSILNGIEASLRSRPNYVGVFSTHPRRDFGKEIKDSTYTTIDFIDHLGYTEFIGLLSKARCIVTDSGGVQEEASIFRRPVLIARDTTERPEILGRNGVLVGTSSKAIKDSLNEILDDIYRYQKLSSFATPFGHGHSAKYIADVLLDK